MVIVQYLKHVTHPIQYLCGYVVLYLVDLCLYNAFMLDSLDVCYFWSILYIQRVCFMYIYIYIYTSNIYIYISHVIRVDFISKHVEIWWQSLYISCYTSRFRQWTCGHMVTISSAFDLVIVFWWHKSSILLALCRSTDSSREEWVSIAMHWWFLDV